MTLLYLDLETIPSQLPGIREEFLAAVQAPGQYKKADSIAEWMRENREAEAEKAWLATSFDGGLGQVCVIGFAFGDEAPASYSVGDLSRDQETQLLQDFFSLLTDRQPTKVIGHNVIGFDLKFLWKRAMVLDVKPPFWLPRDPKPWADNVADTMLMWDKDQRAGGSLDRLCRLFGIPGKLDGMSGADVWPAMLLGKVDDVARYCENDVLVTRALYERMIFA